MRIILITILLFAATSLFAQKTRHISVEILGAQNTVGINYDSRFKGTYGLGYRVGIGMAMAETRAGLTRVSRA